MTASKRPRIGYLSGPAEAERFLMEMRSGASDYFGTNYMKQFLQLAEERDVDAYVITWHRGKDYRRRAGRFLFHNKAMRERSGIYFYLDMLIWHLWVLGRMVLFRPDVMLVTGNPGYWWILFPLRMMGTSFVASYHGLPQPKFGRQKPVNRFFATLSGWLVLRSMPAIVSTSKDISDQVRRLVGPGVTPTIIEHLPSYGRGQFDNIHPVATLPDWPFEIVFVGRIEVDKGVFDVLSAAWSIERNHPGRYRFHFCGDGTQSERLITEIRQRGLDDVAVYHGYCGPDRMRAIMSQCHLSVVPTHADCQAGFEMTCCEAILSGRPLVASAACPALHYLHGASIEVTPGDVDDLQSAILALAHDRDRYRRLAAACDPLQEQFFDPERSWAKAMHKALNLAG